MFSVIIPLYNKKDYIERSVTSVLNQSFKDFELIVVDDASTDGSLDVLHKIKDDRIKILKRETRGHGGYAARNEGMLKAEFDYVSFLDADDEWNKDYLKTIFDLIENFPEATVFLTAWYVKGNQKFKTNAYFNKFKNRGKHIVEGYYKNASRGMNPIHTIVLTANKQSLIDIEGFPEGKCKRGGDIETWMRLMLNNKAAWAPYLGAVYYTNIEGAVTGTVSDAEILYVYKSVNKIERDNLHIEKHADIKKYSNYYAKMSILHSIVFNLNKKETIKGFFKEVDIGIYYFFKILMIFPAFILKPIYKIYRSLKLIISKSDLG